MGEARRYLSQHFGMGIAYRLTEENPARILAERVDLVRGANGILTGVGTPSATVNLIRKRPTREFGGTVDISAERAAAGSGWWLNEQGTGI